MIGQVFSPTKIENILWACMYVFEHVCVFRCYGLRGTLTPTENQKCMKKCSSTQVFPYPHSCSKEAYKTGSNFPYLPFFSAQKALWGWWHKVVACPRVQRKSVLVLPFGHQLYLAIVLAQKSFQLAWKKLMSRIDYSSWSVIWIHPKKSLADWAS